MITLGVLTKHFVKQKGSFRLVCCFSESLEGTEPVEGTEVRKRSMAIEGQRAMEETEGCREDRWIKTGQRDIEGKRAVEETEGRSGGRGLLREQRCSRQHRFQEQTYSSHELYGLFLTCEKINTGQYLHVM